jgi:hypothetical protein
MMPQMAKMLTNEESQKSEWSLDRKIPLALIVTIVSGGIFHTMVLGMWVANTESRLGNLERATIALKTSFDDRIRNNEPRWNSLIRMEERQIATAKTLDDIKKLVEKLEEKVEKK